MIGTSGADGQQMGSLALFAGSCQLTPSLTAACPYATPHAEFG